MHSISCTQKILTFMSEMGECQQYKHTQHAPSMKMECECLCGWIKKTVTYAELLPKMLNPRDIAGNAEEEEEEEDLLRSCQCGAEEGRFVECWQGSVPLHHIDMKLPLPNLIFFLYYRNHSVLFSSSLFPS